MSDVDVMGDSTRSRRALRRFFGNIRLCAALCVAALIAALAGCAAEPLEPGPVPEHAPRLALWQLVRPPEPLDAAAVAGLFPQRIVPSAAPWVSARWSQLPGQNAFNQQLLNRVHAEVGGFTERSGGVAFMPRASPGGSGGASRGCAAGSTMIDSQRLLADPALSARAAAGEPRLALNCDIVFASGGLLGVRTRTTSVDAAGVVTDATTLEYSENGAAALPAAGFVAPEALGEVGELILASLGYSDLPTLFVPAAIARPITAREVEGLGLARLVADSVPTADGSLVFMISLDDLPGGGPTLAQRAAWSAAGVMAGNRVAVQAASPGRWLSESGAAAVATAQAAAPPVWQALPAGRQSIDCGLVPCIAVTFDDGPGADSERLLQVLAASNSAASFFLLGSTAAGAPGIAAAELANGHTVANHSWSHPDLTTLPKGQARVQIMKAQRAITSATGVAPRYLRPPYGALNPEVIAELPLPIVLWSIDTNDWREPGVEALLERVSVAQPGDIILFHDTHASTVDAMPRVIAELQDRGLELITLDELLGEQPTGVRISHG